MSGFTLRPARLVFILALAATVRIGLALLLPNLFWPDEIFQTIEPAHRLAFGNGIESFEWHIGLRSYVLPGVLAGILRVTEPLGAGSAGYLGGVLIALSLLSIWPVAAAARIAGHRGDQVAALFAACLAAVWFDLVYFAPKALTEVVAGHLLVPAIAIGLTAATTSRRPVLIATFLLGLAVALRPHVVPGAAIAWLWFVSRAPKLRLLPALAGAVLPTLLFGLVDWFTHGRAFDSFLVNVSFNVGEGRSLDWGWLPKYYYAVYLWNTWTPPIAVLFGLLWVIGLRRAPLPAAVAIAIIGVHSLLGHKEYRFIYPAIPLLLIGVAVGAATLVAKLRSERQPWATAGGIAVFVAAAVVAGVDFHRQKTPTGLGDKRAPTSYWHAFSGELSAMRDLSKRDDVLGVAVADIDWQYSGGYSWLHHDVPIYFLNRPKTPTPAWPHVNYVVSRSASTPAAFVEVARYGEVRLLRREGTVVDRPDYDLNAILDGR
mgnify:CR=1 FL=1